MRTRWVLCGAAIAAAVCAHPCFTEEIIRIGGTGTAIGSMKLLAAAFEKSHAGLRVEVLPSMGSSGAIRAVEKGVIGIAISSRLLKEEERKLGLSFLEYARTPLMPVTEGTVSSSPLTKEALLRIYRGESTVWPDGRRVRLILRPAGEADTAIIKGISPEMSAAVERAALRQGMQTALTDQDNGQMIAKTPGSFGFLTLTQYITENLALKILAYNGVTPSLRTLADGSYPLFKSLGFVVGPASRPKTGEFITFVRSAEGKRILEESGCLLVDGD